jgi:hypothetical protein
MMVKKTSDHAALLKENRTLKLGIAVFFTILIALSTVAVIYDYSRNKKSED